MTGTAVATLSEQEKAIQEAMGAQNEASDFVIPGLKLTQSLTREVTNDEVEKGHFINSVTKEDYGTAVDFLVVAKYKGRFYSDDNNKAYVASDGSPQAVVPDNWPDEYAGRPFGDVEDAEEQWKAAVNANEHPWGKGPPISTTTNFIGLVVQHVLDDKGEPTDELLPPSELPLRLSMMRKNNPTAQKMSTMIFSWRNVPYERIFVLKAVPKVTNDYPYFAIEATQNGTPSEEYRQAAINMGLSYLKAAASGAVQHVGEDEDSKPAARKREKSGGLDV